MRFIIPGGIRQINHKFYVRLFFQQTLNCEPETNLSHN